jgi:hypothetical protein
MQEQPTTESVEFHDLDRRKVVARFDGGTITSDAGALLLRELDQATGILRDFTACFTDYRAPELIEHTVHQLVAQRVYGLALGYEDLNDHDELRVDPLLATLVGKVDPTGQNRRRKQDRGKPLAGKSTLNRLELTPKTGPESRYKKIVLDGAAVDRFFVEVFLKAHPIPPDRIVLDLDATDDPLHGDQEGRFFHGYYREYCYMPLYIFCGGWLLCARIRQAEKDASAGTVQELERIVPQIRKRWPQVEIVIRADSGFAREEIMAWCEENDVGYVLGLAKNSRLKEAIEEELRQAAELYKETGRGARLYKDFTYSTLKSWSRERRVIGKAEHLAKGANPRFVVTSISAEEIGARELYEEEYCARGDMENRIKEQQLFLFADRTSTAFIWSNQIRLWFSSVAYTLLQYLRAFALEGTSLARAQCNTIRLKLLKIGALVKISIRRVLVSLAESYPYREIFLQTLRAIRRLAFVSC